VTPCPEPLGGVRNLRVTDPTTSTLNVHWEAAEGNVRQHRIYYVPAAGGVEQTVGSGLLTENRAHGALMVMMVAVGGAQGRSMLSTCIDNTL